MKKKNILLTDFTVDTLPAWLAVTRVPGYLVCTDTSILARIAGTFINICSEVIERQQSCRLETDYKHLQKNG